MALGNVQGDEIVKFILDFRPRRDGEAHSAKELGQLIGHLHEDVRVADLRALAGFGDIFKKTRRDRPADRGSHHRESGIDLIRRGVDALAQCGLLFLGNLAEQFHQSLDQSLGSEKFDTRNCSSSAASVTAESSAIASCWTCSICQSRWGSAIIRLFCGSILQSGHVARSRQGRTPMDLSKLPRLSETDKHASQLALLNSPSRKCHRSSLTRPASSHGRTIRSGTGSVLGSALPSARSSN